MTLWYNGRASMTTLTFLFQEIFVVCTDSDVEFFADYSESEDDESDPEIASVSYILFYHLAYYDCYHNPS
jgi:hypothetical protein